ncbi:MAG: sulfatase-like hydrolase/transferase [Phycisphaerae bacterium]
MHPAFGLGQGFDHYENCTSYREVLDAEPASAWAMNPSVMKRSHADVTNPTVFAAFARWLSEHHERRFFLFVHLWDCHFDFIPPEPYRSRFDPDYRGNITGEHFFFDARINAALPRRDIQHLEALYDGEIAWTDAHVDKMLQALSGSGLHENTIVALTSDHGTEFFEHGRKAHRHTLYDELIHVPLVNRFPGRLPAGVRVKSLSRAIDIGPTLLQLAGLPRQDCGVGRSLVPIIEGTEGEPGRVAVSELFSVGRRLRALRTADWKWLLNLNRNRVRYFDLRVDPGELNPLSGDRTPLGQTVASIVPAVLKELEATRARFEATAVDSEIPADVRRQLESLGYVGEGAEGLSEENP